MTRELRREKRLRSRERFFCYAAEVQRLDFSQVAVEKKFEVKTSEKRGNKIDYIRKCDA